MFGLQDFSKHFQGYLVYGVTRNDELYSSNTVNHQGESGIHS